MPTWLAGWAPAARPLARLYAALGYRDRQAMTAQRGLTSISLKSSTSRYTGVHRVVTTRWILTLSKPRSSQAEVTKLETEKSAIEVIAAGYRAHFERERERGDKLMTNTMTLAAVATSARAKAARLESELTARRSQFGMRLCTRRRAAASQHFRSSAPSRPEEPITQLQSIPAAAGRVRTFAGLAALVMFAALIAVLWSMASRS